MATIDPTRFKAFAPRAVPGTLAALQAAAAKHGLTDRLVLAHWLGQMHVESGGYARLSESLNYSTTRLRSLFGRHRISDADCLRLGRLETVVNGKKVVTRAADQQGIANAVYGGAWGLAQLGNSQAGDGWRFRGGGYKQLTGRANYERYDVTADALLDPATSADVAARFFVDKGCVAKAKRDDVEAVTLLINGGRNGLADRRTQTAKARGVVG